MKSISFLSSFLILSCFVFLFSGTTFIIQEGGKEVGRWEEHDGKDGTEIISRDKPAEKPEPAQYEVTAYEANTNEPASFKKTTDAPQVAVWKVSGQVIDHVSLQGVPNAEITFTGGPGPMTVTTDGAGFFITKLPQLKDKAYSFNCQASAKYSQGCKTHKGRAYLKTSYGERLQSFSVVGFDSAKDFYINGDSYDLIFTMKRKVLSEKERHDYYAMQRAAAPA